MDTRIASPLDGSIYCRTPPPHFVRHGNRLFRFVESIGPKSRYHSVSCSVQNHKISTFDSIVPEFFNYDDILCFPTVKRMERYQSSLLILSTKRHSRFYCPTKWGGRAGTICYHLGYTELFRKMMVWDLGVRVSDGSSS